MKLDMNKQHYQTAGRNEIVIDTEVDPTFGLDRDNSSVEISPMKVYGANPAQVSSVKMGTIKKLDYETTMKNKFKNPVKLGKVPEKEDRSKWVSR